MKLKFKKIKITVAIRCRKYFLFVNWRTCDIWLCIYIHINKHYCTLQQYMETYILTSYKANQFRTRALIYGYILYRIGRPRQLADYLGLCRRQRPCMCCVLRLTNDLDAALYAWHRGQCKVISTDSIHILNFKLNGRSEYPRWT